MRGMARDALDDRARNARAMVLRRGPRDAVITDHRIGEREQLARVRRIGERFFVARHAGKEDGFAESERIVADAFAVEARTVGEKQ